MDKKQLSERDICTKFITPALRRAGWDELTQLREEVSFTKGRVEATLVSGEDHRSRLLNALLAEALAPIEFEVM